MNSIIKNKKELETSDLRKHALEILEAGYHSVLTETILEDNFFLKENILKIKNKKYDLKEYEKIYIIAVGKCANASAKKVEEILGNKIEDGIVLDVEVAKFKKLKSLKGTHPFPSEDNISATKEIIDILEKAKKKDLVLSFISGGGSALLCAPSLGVDCEMLKGISSELMNRGASINELNIVRKHLSQIKGGYFAKHVSPAKLVSVIFSDVPGDDISSVASGPTVLDITTKEDARMILEAYSFGEYTGTLGGAISFLSETPKEIETFKFVDNILMLTNVVALEEMEKKAEELGYKAIIESSELQGEVNEIVEKIMEEPRDSKTCVIYGGETTVKIKGGGKGGRNQEFALSTLRFLEKDVLVVAVASDGWDNSDVAGALVDEEILKSVKEKKLEVIEFLKENNSYEFFEKVGGHIKTGRTGVNVADFYLIIKK
ncbi:MAG: DUF4147 domain-containing protein [Patescibacteria group bacterium]